MVVVDLNAISCFRLFSIRIRQEGLLVVVVIFSNDSNGLAVGGVFSLVVVDIVTGDAVICVIDDSPSTDFWGGVVDEAVVGEVVVGIVLVEIVGVVLALVEKVVTVVEVIEAVSVFGVGTVVDATEILSVGVRVFFS